MEWTRDAGCCWWVGTRACTVVRLFVRQTYLQSHHPVQMCICLRPSFIYLLSGEVLVRTHGRLQRQAKPRYEVFILGVVSRRGAKKPTIPRPGGPADLQTRHLSTCADDAQNEQNLTFWRLIFSKIARCARMRTRTASHNPICMPVLRLNIIPPREKSRGVIKTENHPLPPFDRPADGRG